MLSISSIYYCHSFFLLPPKTPTFLYFVIIIISQPIHIAFANCSCEPQTKDDQNKEHHHAEALHYKLASLASILIFSALGVSIPLVLKKIRSAALQTDTALHFLSKAFSAGVILATGFLHILPDAFEALNSPCQGEKPWGGFPFAGFMAMVSAIVTLMMEGFASGYHARAELRKAQPLNGDTIDDEEIIVSHNLTVSSDGGHVAHGPAVLLERSNSSSLIRHRIISQVLELGIVVHSVIIGISLGATQSPKTIKPLMIALSFHQFFEGIGLGGCISQANFKARAVIIMVLFFSLTTPTGIAVGTMISKGYNEQSSTALIVQGILNSASAGILIYMALVDLLAPDFLNPKLLTNFRLQLLANVALLLGACCMSLLAKWGGA